MSDKTKKILIAAFAVLCIAAYFIIEANEARQHSSAGYEEYEQQHWKEVEQEEREALTADAITCDIAKEHIGETVLVKGEVVRIYTANESSGSPTFIDLDYEYPSKDRVSIVVWEEDLDDFFFLIDELSIGDTLYVEGYVEEYDGTAQIHSSTIGYTYCE